MVGYVSPRPNRSFAMTGGFRAIIGGTGGMETRLAQFSIVVVGQVHNPTILNPDFLTLRDIVPADWGWKTEATLTTPPFAFVRYASGMSIVVEQNKLQVVDARCDAPADSKASHIAQRYVTTLPHVKYMAVGNNFQCIVKVEKPSIFLRDRFLKPGKWNSADRRLDGLGLQFVYPLPQGRVVLSLDVGEVKDKTSEEEEHLEEIIVANANFHRDCTGYPADAEVAALIQKYQFDWEFCKELLHDVLGVEWTKE